MSRRRFAVTSFAMLALSAAIAGCTNLGGLLTGGASPTPDGVPSFESLIPSRQATSAADDSLTFTVSASAPGAHPLVYTWQASAGTLSATQGNTVTWKAADAKGAKLAAGTVVLTVSASDGPQRVSRDIVLTVDANGIATMPTINVVQAPTSPPGGVVDTSASGTATATAAPNLPCQIGTVFPTLAAPGSLIYITGQGFTGSPSVSVGGQAAQVVSVKPQWIAALVPDSAQASDTAVPVSVSACGATQSAGNLLLGGEDAFGAAATQPGQGLLVQVYSIPDDTETLPDLSTLSPVTTFLASTIAVPATGLTSGISTASDPITDDFALRYTGQLYVESPGFTDFSLGSQDGSKLLIDGASIVNNDGVQGSAKSGTGSANLSRGLHTFELDYFNVSGGNVALTLTWSAPGGLGGAIPASAFKLPAALAP